MSNKIAYEQGVTAALEKFALLPGMGVMRAATSPVVSRKAMRKRVFAPSQNAHMAPGQAAATAAAKQGVLGKAWGGLNAIAANPVGQIGLMMGVPMAINAMSGPSSDQSGR